MRKLAWAVLALLLVPLLGGALACRQPASDSKKSIVVTYSVLGSIVKDMVGDSATVTVSVPNGLDPHDWYPSARDIERINKADLVVQNGLGLEAGMQKALDSAKNAGVKFFTASDSITVRHVGAGEGIPSGDPDQQLGAPDPHLWMDPLAMKDVVAGLAPVLKSITGLDVAGRAADLESRLDALNADVGRILSGVPSQNKVLVTGHESMGYFAQRYGFKIVGVIVPSLSSQAAPSAGDIALLQKAISDNHVKAIFTELGTSPAVAGAIGESTGVKAVELITHALPADGSYFTFMMNMGNVVANALK
ncbi:MAG: metal ABC transporter substrate-binding protein [Dehalococcoidia bacterium]|nr:metal ABC transporter substrate-binding protein [Dehalococcoidia bacterium]